MNNLNSVLVEGNLTRDPELKYTGSGTAVCNLAIASNRYFRKDDEYQEEVSYFDIVVWNRQAEACSEHLRKGRQIRIIGRLQQQRWSAEDGTNRSKVVIVAEHVEFGKKKKEEGDG